MIAITKIDALLIKLLILFYIILKILVSTPIISSRTSISGFNEDITQKPSLSLIPDEYVLTGKLI